MNWSQVQHDFLVQAWHQLRPWAQNPILHLCAMSHSTPRFRCLQAWMWDQTQPRVQLCCTSTRCFVHAHPTNIFIKTGFWSYRSWWMSADSLPKLPQEKKHQLFPMSQYWDTSTLYQTCFPILQGRMAPPSPGRFDSCSPLPPTQPMHSPRVNKTLFFPPNLPSKMSHCSTLGEHYFFPLSPADPRELHTIIVWFLKQFFEISNNFQKVRGDITDAFSHYWIHFNLWSLHSQNYWITALTPAFYSVCLSPS